MLLKVFFGVIDKLKGNNKDYPLQKQDV